MRRAAIEMEKVVMWAIGVLLALVLIYFIVTQLLPSSEDGFVRNLLARLDIL